MRTALYCSEGIIEVRNSGLFIGDCFNIIVVKDSVPSDTEMSHAETLSETATNLTIIRALQGLKSLPAE
jgi:hypothetical protein